MKITTAHASPGLFRRPVRVTQLESLSGAALSDQRLTEGGPLPYPVSTGVALALGTTVYVPGYLRLKPLTTVKESGGKGAEKVSLADITKNVGIGGGLASLPLSLISLSKSTTESQLAALLNSYGFAPSASDQIASSGLGFARSNAGQICCLFMAGGLVTIGVVEALRPGWTWKRKLLLGAIGGLTLIIVALALIYFGIWGQTARGEKKAVPDQVKETSEPLQAR